MRPRTDLVLGTWGLSGAFGQLSCGETKESVISAALEQGVRRFDTAPVYGGGEVERALGALCNDDIEIATKVAAVIKPVAALPHIDIAVCYPTDHVRRSIDDSLRRLRRGRIDILQFHNWHSSWNAGYMFELIEKLRLDGTVHRWGVSLPDEFRSTPPAGFDVIQAPFNLAEQWARDTLGSYRGEVRARSIFAHGALTGTTLDSLPPTDARRSKFSQKFLEKISRIPVDDGASKARLVEQALLFAAAEPWISKIIIGVRSRSQLTGILDVEFTTSD